MKLNVAMLAGVFAISVAAKPVAEPGLHDFAEGIELITHSSQPLQELTLPDRVYATMTQWNAADIRIFNANGQSVPYALCPAMTNDDITQHAMVPVYGLDASSTSIKGNNITLRTSDGTQLNVHGDDTTRFRSNASYVLDLSKIDHAVTSIKLDWSTPSGDSETALQVFSSNDLSHWQLISNTKLLRAISADHATLEQSGISLPAARYQYLRIEPSGALTIHHAQAEYQIAATPAQPVWYSAGAPYGTDDIHELRYENSHRAPVSFLRITPHVENSSLHVTVQSRDREDHAWQTQWSGEVFDVSDGNQHRHNDIIHVPATYALEWRLLFAENSEPPASAPSFELGYLPMQLRFLAQGQGPYMLAFGNAGVSTSKAQQCDSLLSGISEQEKRKLTGAPAIGELHILAGSNALKLRHAIPARTLILWGILLVGVVIIVRSALSMLKHSKQQDQE
ncbi:MAG: DUF3999 family protein [Steroidobacter sp.]